MIAAGKTKRTWVGQSGRVYSYQVRSITDPIKRGAGNFIVGFADAGGWWTPLYMGESSRLATLLGNPELITWLRRLGATHLHVHSSSDRASRSAEKADLISRFRPPLNDSLI